MHFSVDAKLIETECSTITNYPDADCRLEFNETHIVNILDGHKTEVNSITMKLYS